VEKYRKLFGAVLGGATAGAVIAILDAVGVQVDLATATTIAGVLASIGTLVAPRNAA
jgi:hypothetical protein